MFVDFCKVFDSIHRAKIEQIFLVYGLSKITVTVIMMLNKYSKAMVHSSNGDTEFFDIVCGLFQGDTLAPYFLIICLDYILWTSVDLKKENDLILKKARSRWYPAVTITNADFTDDLAFLTNILTSWMPAA